MVGIAAVALLGILQTPVQILGKDVSLAVPADLPLDPPAEVQNWVGWKGVQVPGATILPKLCTVDHGLAEYIKGLTGQPAADAPVWHIKLLISRRVEFGLFRQSMTNGNVERILKAVAIAKRAIESQTGLRVEIDAQDDLAPMTDGMGDAIRTSILTRVNRGAFEADDKRFRGPYQSVLEFGLTDLQQDGFGANITGYKLDPPGEVSNGVADNYSAGAFASSGSSLGTLAKELIGTESSAAANLLDHQNFEFAGSPLLQLASHSKADQQMALYGIPQERKVHTFRQWIVAEPTGLIGKRAWTEDVQLRITGDDGHGPSLEIASSGDGYGSGASLFTSPKDAKKKLVFWVRHVSGGLRVVDLKPIFDSPKINDQTNSEFGWILPADNSWHRLSLDLSAVPIAEGAKEGVVTLGSPGLTKVIADEPIYQFADFQLVDAAPADAEQIDRKKLEDVYKNVADLAAADPATPEGLTLLKSALTGTDRARKLTALYTLRAKKLAGTEAIIATAMDDVDGTVAEAGASALGAIGTDEAWAALRKALDHGVSEREKAAAGAALAARKNPTFLGALSPLMVARSYEARIMVIKAIHDNGGPLEQTLLSAFLDQPEPEVRYTAAGFLDPMDDASAKKLLFASINDASDAVRELACERLLENPAYLKDGQRAIQDDSRWVRIQMLQHMAQRKKKEDRPALSQAVTSTDFEIRVAALKAFLESPDNVEASEIGGVVFKDPSPTVQELLKELVAKKGLKLP